MLQVLLSVLQQKNLKAARRTATLPADNLRLSNRSAWHSRMCRGPKRSGEQWKCRAKSSTEQNPRLRGCTNVWYVERNYGVGVLPALFCEDGSQEHLL
jgi:hypothetical protein